MKTHAQAVALLSVKNRMRPTQRGRHAPHSRPARKRRPPPAPMLARPLAVVVVGVDPGLTRSGWSIWTCGKLVRYGEVSDCNPVAISAVLNAAALLAEIGAADQNSHASGATDASCARSPAIPTALPVVLVCEKAPPAAVAFASTGYATAGNSAARNVWRYAWRSAGYSDRRFVLVALNRWRSQVLGRGWGGAGVGREQVRKEEMRAARAVADASGEMRDVIGPDAAPGILIGRFACHAPEVLAALQKKVRARA